MFLHDSYNRRISYLRVSLTDRCNLRCFYCRGGDVKSFAKSEILTLEEVEFVVKVFHGYFGIDKVRLTGGEPLMRRGVELLIERLGGMNLELNMTTNGILLERFSGILSEFGVGVNVSLDTLDPAKFEMISGFDCLDRVLRGIESVLRRGVKLKINTVVLRGINDEEVFDLIEFARSIGVEIRFIEFMPFVDEGIWRRYFIPEDEIRVRVEERFGLRFFEERGTSRVYILDDGTRVGFISPVTKPFCRGCSRLRLTSDGRLVLCMFDRFSYSIKEFLRPVFRAEELVGFIRGIVSRKPAGFIELVEKRGKFEMIKLGG